MSVCGVVRILERTNARRQTVVGWNGDAGWRYAGIVAHRPPFIHLRDVLQVREHRGFAHLAAILVGDLQHQFVIAGRRAAENEVIAQGMGVRVAAQTDREQQADWKSYVAEKCIGADVDLI